MRSFAHYANEPSGRTTLPEYMDDQIRKQRDTQGMTQTEANVVDFVPFLTLVYIHGYQIRMIVVRNFPRQRNAFAELGKRRRSRIPPLPTLHHRNI